MKEFIVEFMGPPNPRNNSSNPDLDTRRLPFSQNRILATRSVILSIRFHEYFNIIQKTHIRSVCTDVESKSKVLYQQNKWLRFLSLFNCTYLERRWKATKENIFEIFSSHLSLQIWKSLTSDVNKPTKYGKISSNCRRSSLVLLFVSSETGVTGMSLQNILWGRHFRPKDVMI